MTLLIKLLESVTQLKDRICLGALFLVSIVGIAIAQPMPCSPSEFLLRRSCTHKFLRILRRQISRRM